LETLLTAPGKPGNVVLSKYAAAMILLHDSVAARHSCSSRCSCGPPNCRRPGRPGRLSEPFTAVMLDGRRLTAVGCLRLRHHLQPKSFAGHAHHRLAGHSVFPGVRTVICGRVGSPAHRSFHIYFMLHGSCQSSPADDRFAAGGVLPQCRRVSCCSHYQVVDFRRWNAETHNSAPCRKSASEP